MDANHLPIDSAPGGSCVHAHSRWSVVKFIQLWVCALWLGAAGCHWFPAEHRKDSKGPLVLPQMTRGAAVLEVYSIRFPAGQKEFNEELWQETDQQLLSPETRAMLTANGFKVASAGIAVRDRLASLLAGQTPESHSTSAGEVSVIDSEGRVSRSQLQASPGSRKEIQVTGSATAVNVLFQTLEGELVGQTYPMAQGVLSVKARPQPDGRVLFTYTPEIQYGVARQSWVPLDGGNFRFDTSRPRFIFEELRFESLLAADDMLVIGMDPNRPGSLGHAFFADRNSAGEDTQKLLFIRLLQTQHEPLFDAEEVKEVPASAGSIGPLEPAKPNP